MLLATRAWLAFYGSLRAKCRWANFLRRLSFFHEGRKFTPRSRRSLTSSRRPTSRLLRFEQIEPRRLLSVTPSFDNGWLTFEGDSANDTIAVAADSSSYVTLNGQQILGELTASEGTLLVAHGGGGNDTIDLRGVHAAEFSSLSESNAYEDDGNDILYASELGSLRC